MAKPRQVRVEEAVMALFELNREYLTTSQQEGLRALEIKEVLTEMSGKICNIALKLIGIPERSLVDDGVAFEMNATDDDRELGKYPDRLRNQLYGFFFYEDADFFLDCCRKEIRELAEKQNAKDADEAARKASGITD